MSDLACTELQLAMQSIAASLGVGCDHCHVTGPGGAFDRDDKETKDTARAMMKMVAEINTRAFEGRSVVACATCHHGESKPMRTPPIATEMTAWQAAAAARAREQGRGRGGFGGPGGRRRKVRTRRLAARCPRPGGAAGGPGPHQQPVQRNPKPTETVDQVLDKYVQALGGRTRSKDSIASDDRDGDAAGPAAGAGDGRREAAEFLPAGHSIAAAATDAGRPPERPCGEAAAAGACRASRRSRRRGVPIWERRST